MLLCHVTYKEQISYYYIFYILITFVCYCLRIGCEYFLVYFSLMPVVIDYICLLIIFVCVFTVCVCV